MAKIKGYPKTPLLLTRLNYTNRNKPIFLSAVVFFLGVIANYSAQACKQFFGVNLSYVRPGTRFDLTCSHPGWAKKKKFHFY